MVILLACWPGPLPDCPDCAARDDADADGYSPEAGDCDDADGGRHPGAPEACNGIDDDCDGAVDDDPTGADALWTDADHDGYGAGAPSPACPGEGVAAQNGDCDDADPTVSPDALEECDDGIDNDCDGTASGCRPEGVVSAGAATRLSGDFAYEELGYAAVLADGLWMGGPGYGNPNAGRAVWVVPGERPATGEAGAVAQGQLLGERIGDLLGSALAAGDGRLYARALLPTSANPGAIFVLDPPTSVVGPDDAWATLEGGPTDELGEDLSVARDGALAVTVGAVIGAGWWVPEVPAGRQDVADVGVPLGIPDLERVLAADLSGDGTADLLAGAPGRGWTSRGEGAVFLFLGPIDGPVADEDAVGVGFGPSAGASAGGALGLLDDLAGDGLADAFVGAPDADGAAWLLAGAWSGEQDLDGLAAVRLSGDEALAPSTAATGDFDGDGALDLAFGDPAANGAATSAGGAWLWFGPVPGGTLPAASAEIQGEGANHHLGRALSAGDFDGDGRADLAIGAPGASFTAENAGAVYLWWGVGG